MLQKLAFVSLALLASTSAFAAKVTVPTIVMCQQEEGDFYIDVGVIKNDGPGYRILVVENDLDEGTSTLVNDIRVSESVFGRTTTYEDRDETVRLEIAETIRGAQRKADFTMLRDGPGSIQEDGLLCYENTGISYDAK